MALVSGDVRALYERFPYPSRSRLTKKSLQKYLFWVLPAFGEKDLSFFEGKRVLDVGCGTGEFSCALALHGASVLGIDFSQASIKKARQNARLLKAKNVEFECADLFESVPEEKFAVVFSLGVLHHTHDAKKAFHQVVSFCARDGFVCVGLYNKIGRARHRLKRVLLKVLAGNNVEKRMALAKKLFLGEKDFDDARLADKFGQLHESYHSVGEVLKWFKRNNLVFVGARPKLKGNFLVQQAKWLLQKRGAFFVLAGKKQ